MMLRSGRINIISTIINMIIVQHLHESDIQWCSRNLKDFHFKGNLNKTNLQTRIYLAYMNWIPRNDWTVGKIVQEEVLNLKTSNHHTPPWEFQAAFHR